MSLGTSLIISYAVEGAFYILLLLYTVHTLFLAYHWFSYGSSRKISLTALAIHLIGGAVLFATIAAGMALA